MLTYSYYINNGRHSSEYNVVNATGAVLSAYDYVFNGDGQITYAQEGTSTNPATNNATTLNYSYDGLGHLTNETRNGTAPENISYAYDAMGNRVSQSGSYLNGTFAYDADDELTSFTYSGTSYASATFGYDADGQRTSEVTGLSPGFGGYALQYGYDFDGNLTGITAAGQSAVGFVYDGLDRQLGWQSGGKQLDYQLDGNAPLTETNQTSSRMNLYGNGLVSAGGETLLYDGLGAVRQTTGSGSPVAQWSGSYQAYGVASSASGSTGSPYQWGAGSGYRSDGFGPAYAAPLQKVGARYYDPEFGCFLTRDTDLGQRPYAYCNSDPINFRDPTGHDDQDPDPDYEYIGGNGDSSGNTGTGGGSPGGSGSGGGAGGSGIGPVGGDGSGSAGSGPSVGDTSGVKAPPGVDVPNPGQVFQSGQVTGVVGRDGGGAMIILIPLGGTWTLRVGASGGSGDHGAGGIFTFNF